MPSQEPLPREWFEIGVDTCDLKESLVVNTIVIEWEHLDERADLALKTPYQILDEIFGASD
jgi:hypothetical protein